MYNEYVLIVIVFDLIFTDSDRDSIFHRLFTFLSVQFFLVILLNVFVCYIIFFFQAEDGIRDIGVTGVQTCALPIWAVFSQGAPLRSRVERRLPALSSLRGQRPAQDTRWAAVGKRRMSLPISATMARAASSPTPGTVRSRRTASRKGSRPRSPSASTSASAAASASYWPRCRRSRKRCRSVTRPVSAARSRAGSALTRGWTRASSRSGSRSPATSASRIARPLRPVMSVSTDASLRLASSSVFCSRCTWLACSRTSCLRVRRSARSARVAGSGTKLGRISPCASNSASQDASATSVLRPGRFFTCAALARISTRSPSNSTCQTRSEEHTSELQSRQYLVCRLLLEKKKKINKCLLIELLNSIISSLLYYIRHIKDLSNKY